ncbi:MAG: PhoH family protein [Bacteroidales bacterium]|nr:PhoH family protein [Bacteroidales bacterium]
MRTSKPAKKKSATKIFVLDTNIILHDHNAIRQFKDNDIVIPVAVIEELDKFKKGNDSLSFNARAFMREISAIIDGHKLGPNGISIGPKMGRLKVEPNHPFAPEMQDFFRDDIQDHRILATAMWVRDNNPGRFVALVTKDLNLRLKAKAVDMEVQDYLTDRVDEEAMDNMVREVICMEAEPEAMQSLAYGPTTSIPWKEIAVKEPAPNQLYKFSFSGAIVLGRYDKHRQEIVLVKNHEAAGIRPRNDEQRFALDACLNPHIPLVSLTGGAGTGKTLIALAAAIEQAQDYDQIILSRPTVILGGQDIGFLPGDQKSKMSPYIQPLMDNLDVIRHCYRPGSKQAQRIEALIKEEKLVISPLAYIRGRSLGKVYFIVDEAQNLTPHECKTIITRAGEGTKMVFTGDIFQIDQPYLDEWSNGLSHLGEKMAGQELFEHIFLSKGERSELSEIASKLL